MAIEGARTAAGDTAGKPAKADGKAGRKRRSAFWRKGDDARSGKGRRGEKREKKSGKEKGAAETTAQDIMPFTSVQGSFIRRKDGAKMLLVRMSGTNDSLYTYAQKVRESEGISAALVAIGRPASILKLPRAIDANASLVFIDNQIAWLERELLQEGVSDRNDPRQVRLRLLREHVRPEAEHEALAGDKFEHPTYMALEFDADTADETAKREAQIFADRVCDHGREAHICDHDETIEAIMLYFTPSRVDVGSTMGRSPIMAITKKKRSAK